MVVVAYATIGNKFLLRAEAFHCKMSNDQGPIQSEIQAVLIGRGGPLWIIIQILILLYPPPPENQINYSCEIKDCE